jgi:hypothetical protein
MPHQLDGSTLEQVRRGMIRRFERLFVVAGLLGAAACTPLAPSSPPSRQLPAYAGRAITLFDDQIEPAGVGMDFDKGYSPKADRMLRERAQRSDAVLRVRVQTVTGKTDGPSKTYTLGLHVVEKLAGDHPPAADFSVAVGRLSESYGIVKNFEGRLVGYAFIAFVREFALPDPERAIHLHLSPDTKDVKTAVGDAVVLGEEIEAK